jgi:RNA polymerase sigma-54 factor
MAVGPRLELRIGQSLVMTPQLQQAIKLLQMSNLELTEFVEEELSQNPLLERDEAAEPAYEPDGAVSADDDEFGDDGSSGDGDGAEGASFDSVAESNLTDNKDLDVETDNLWADDSQADLAGTLGSTDWSSVGAGGGSFDDFSGDYEQTSAGKISLRDHLTNQIQLELTDPVDRVIAAHLVDMVDEAGYVTGDLGALAALLNCPRDRVEATLARLQQFEPSGICARNLAECLALQLRDRDRFDPAIEVMLENLDMLARREFDKLAKKCGVDREDMLDMIAEIQSLDPKPALVFDHSLSQPITPDVIMRPGPGETWVIELNTDTLPRVLVNNQYYARISRDIRDKSEKQYLADRLQQANWLAKSLHQRATTILRVATEIVKQQNGFFAKGVEHLRPLVLRDIADAIEMHESTVSRVTSNKYIETPRGIYELKYFFTPAIASSAGGDAHSAEAVRHRIKVLIDAESASAVLSDDKLVELLNSDGIDIARRTVAKYREAMRIPSSVQRRREKTMALTR